VLHILRILEKKGYPIMYDDCFDKDYSIKTIHVTFYDQEKFDTLPDKYSEQRTYDGEITIFIKLDKGYTQEQYNNHIRILYYWAINLPEKK
jgi:hypothetical protein